MVEARDPIGGDEARRSVLRRGPCRIL